MVRRIGYGLGVAGVAVAAALTVRYLWSGAHAGRDAGWDKARVLLLVALLAGLPWVARRRGMFGPVGRSVAARVVRAGGSAALVALVLDIARIEHYSSPAAPNPWSQIAGTWNWAEEAAALVLIAAYLTAVLNVTARRPQARPVLAAWCAAAGGLVLFFTVAPLQALIAVYAAGILAATSRRSPVTPATLAISSGTGVGGGLLVVALWNPLRSPPAPGLTPKTNVIMLFILLIVTIALGTVVAGAVAIRRAGGTDNPLARKARVPQFLAAGPLTAASAALMLPLLRARYAIHFAAVCPATHHFHCTAAPAIWVFFLVIGPVIGLAIGTLAGSIPAPAPQPPRQPPPEPPQEPGPEPDGSRSGGVGVFVKI